MIEVGIRGHILNISSASCSKARGIPATADEIANLVVLMVSGMEDMIVRDTHFISGDRNNVFG